MKNKYEIRDKTTVIFYTNRKGENFEILIDTEDLGKIDKFPSWHIFRKNNNIFIKSHTKTGSIFLPNIIIKYDTKINICFYLNKNKLDNRKNNLKIINNGRGFVNSYVEKEGYIIIEYFNTSGQKFEILVDKEDFYKIKDYGWAVFKSKKRYYARAICNKKGILIHMIILDYDKSKFQCDHINRNGLDNRKENLRICTPQENIRNQGLSTKNTSGTKGVSFRKDSKRWGAVISISLGSFDSKEEAVKARKDAELKYWGNFYIHPI